MIEFNDIYFKVDSIIVEEGFWHADIVEKKNLIDKGLRLYAIEKLKTINYNHYLLSVSDSNLCLNDLVSMLACDISKEEHFNTLRHFVHYILNIAGSIQNRSIVWWDEDNEALIAVPVIDFNEDGYWESLITHKETDYVQIFNFVYEVFNNKFFVDNVYKRLRIKSDETKNNK